MLNDGIRKGLTLCAWLCICPGFANASDNTLPADAWRIPFNVEQRVPSPGGEAHNGPIVQRDIYEFAWQSFIALNWPHRRGSERGEPDREGKLAPIRNDNRPLPAVVWMTYLTPAQVFTDPRGWDVRWTGTGTGGSDPAFLNLQPADYTSSTLATSFAPGINQPYTNANVPTGPVADQNGNYLRFLVTMNRSYFEYVKRFRYYDADVQERAVNNFLEFVATHDHAPEPVIGSGQRARYFQPVPTGLEYYIDDLPVYARQGLVEVKAAWKVLKTSGEHADIPGRFYRRVMQFPLPDGSLSPPRLMGLVGLHIHSVTPFGHLPSTFEQIDNVALIYPDDGPLPLPNHPSLNPGSDGGSPPPYPNGYEVNGASGKAGLIPEPFVNGEALPSRTLRPSVNISRVTPIPDAVEAVNRKYREQLKDTVWRYYQLVGAQNKNLNRGINSHLGPGIAGAQQSNVQNLVNSTLESYTQNGFSCARCHLNAFPLGVPTFPPYEEKFSSLHVMSFLLQTAKSGSSDP